MKPTRRSPTRRSPPLSSSSSFVSLIVLFQLLLVSDQIQPIHSQQQQQQQYQPITNTGLYTKRCFADAASAAALGTLVLQALWSELVQTECNVAQMAAVYDQYFREDVLVQDISGAILANGLEEWKAMSLGINSDNANNNDENHNVNWAYACEYQKLQFEATEDAFTEPEVFNDFVWIGNELVTDSSWSDLKQKGDALSQQQQRPRQYFIEMIGKSGSFLYGGSDSSSSSSKDGKGKGSSGSRRYHDPSHWLYEHYGSGSTGGKGKSGTAGNHLDNHNIPYTPHCHRPQIYGIVLG